MTEISVRASSLPEYSDCERRFAARHIPAVREAFQLRQVPNTIGACVGTALHSGVAHMLVAKMETGRLPGTAASSQEVTIESLRQQVSGQPTLWDDTSTSANVAEAQALRMTKAYYEFIAPQVVPVAVEKKMSARFSPTMLVTGSLDVAENDQINDTKSGVARRPHHPQFGCYSLLRRAAGETVERFNEHYVPRSTISRPQRMPEVHSYPVETCEQAAVAVLRRIDATAQQFSRTGDPWTWLPNPSSQLCGEKYCPAHGTTFCRAHKA